MRDIFQLQRFLCHVTKKVNEVVFGKLSVFPLHLSGANWHMARFELQVHLRLRQI